MSHVVKLRISTFQTHPKKTVNTGSTSFFGRYGRIASTNSPSFCMKTVNASLTKLTALLPQTRDCSCYTGCHRRNRPNFRRVFLMLNYTDITQNTYIQS